MTVYLLLVSLPLLVLLVGGAPAGRAFWWDLSKALGFSAISMLGVQFVLTGRFRKLSAPFGIDIVYFVHRYLAIAAVVFAVAHFGIIWFAYREQAGPVLPWDAPWYMTAGRAALLLFVAAVVTSEWRAKLGLDYGVWRHLHIVLATLGFVAAVAHILGVGSYTQTPLKRALWLSLTVSWLGLGIWVRLIRPALLKRHPYRITEVREEGERTWTLVMEPVGKPLLTSFDPGQFAWLTLRSSPFAAREHPFSISSAPGRLPAVEMTIRSLGDFTEKMQHVEPGERAYLDGPYGIFTYKGYPAAPGFGFLVGGVGITPVISMLRNMAEEGEKRPLWLFYANPNADGVLFRDQIEQLAKRLNLTVVHIPQEPPPGWEGESGLLSKRMILRHAPVERCPALHWFICGPPPMLAAAEEHLQQLGVPPGHINVEVFNF